MLERKFRAALTAAKTRQTPLVIVGCRLCLRPELERELTVVEFQLLDKIVPESVYQGVLSSAFLRPSEADETERAIEAACGLTTMEAENSFALSVIQAKTISPAVVALGRRPRP